MFSAGKICWGLTQNFLDCSRELLGHWSRPHLSGNVHNIIEGNVAAVFNCNQTPLLEYLHNCSSFAILLFFCFLRSRGGSFRALITKAAAEGTTEIVAWRFWIFSCTVILRPFQSAVPLAMSSPTFLGDWKQKTCSHTATIVELRLETADFGIFEQCFEDTHQTQGTDFGGQRRSSAHFTSNTSQVNCKKTVVENCEQFAYLMLVFFRKSHTYRA